MDSIMEMLKCNFETKIVDNSTLLKMDPAQGGGFVIRLSPVIINNLANKESMPQNATFERTNRQIHINWNNETIQFRLFNMLGHTTSYGNLYGCSSIPVDNIDDGIYFLNCKTPSTEKSLN